MSWHVSHDIGAVTVWVKEADPGTGAVSWGMPWRKEPRLIPVRSLFGLSGNGDATFRMLRRYRNDGDGSIYDSGVPVGSYIAITPNTDEPNDADPDTTENALWWGYVASRDYTCLAVNDSAQTNPDEVGTVHGRGLGDLMDRARLAGWREGATPPSRVLKTAPIANPAIAGGQPSGNHVDGSDGASLFSTSLTAPGGAAFGFWTRRRLLNHILAYCRPAGMPAMRLSAIDADVLAMLDEDERLTWDLSHLTLRGALDLLISRSRGLVWSLWPRAHEWRIYVDSCAAADSGSMKANPLREVDTADADVATVEFGEEVAYDAVTVRGGRHVFGFTVALGDLTAERGWTGAQETAYLAGASASLSYEDLTLAEKKQANREKRQGVLGDVFTLYRLQVQFAGLGGGHFAHRGATSGTGAGTLKAACPRVTWNGTAVSLGTATSWDDFATPNLPMARLLRTIPWEDTKQASDSDPSGSPRYMTPRVYRYDSAADHKWADLLAGGDGHQGAQVDIDDRSCALRVVMSPPELLAKGHWSGAAYPWSLDPDTDPRAHDYNDLVFTVALESDEHIEVTVLRSGVSPDGVRRPLILEDETLQFWHIHGGTIIGLTDEREADRIDSSGINVRNDWAAAQKWAEQTAAWALATRTPATITLAHPDVRHEWAEVGELLSEVIERAPSEPDQEGRELYRRTVQSTVESVERIYDAEDGGRPRTIVRTMVVEPPVRRGSGASPVGGGPVSGVLKGTPAQAIIQTRERVARLERDGQRVPLVLPKPATELDRARLFQVTKAGHGWTVGKWIHPGEDPVVLADTDDDGGTLPIALIVEVLDADNVVCAGPGLHHLPAFEFDAWKRYYLADAGVSEVEPAPDEGSSAKTAPEWARMTHLALADGWVWIPTPASRNHTHHLGWLADVSTRGDHEPEDGQTLIYDLASGLWIPGDAGGIGGLGEGTPLSVLGVAGNVGAPYADIVAADDNGVLLRDGNALVFDLIIGANIAAGGVLTGNIGDGQVTAAKLAADVTIDALGDTTITSVAADHFLKWNGTAWVNWPLGPIVWTDPAASIPVLAMDGGATGAATIIGLGHDSSRLILGGINGVTSGASLEFLLSGDPDAGTEVVARVRRVSTSQVSFYDQGSSVITDGTEVVRWDCSATAASRLWYFKTRFHIAAKSTLQTRGLWNEDGCAIDGANTDWVSPSLGGTYRIGSLRLGNPGITMPDGFAIADDPGVILHGVTKGATGSTSGVLELGLNHATYGVRLRTIDGNGTDARDILIQSARSVAVIAAEDFTVTATDDITLTTSDDLTLTVGDDFALTCQGGSIISVAASSATSSVITIGNTGFQTSVYLHAGASGSVMVGSAGTVLGYFGAIGVVKQTVTGSKAGNAALASLLSALSQHGFITDSST